MADLEQDMTEVAEEIYWSCMKKENDDNKCKLHTAKMLYLMGYRKVNGVWTNQHKGVPNNKKIKPLKQLVDKIVPA